MPMLAIVEAVSTASAVSKPVLAGRANSRFLGPITLDIERAGTTGGGTVYGANLPYSQAETTKYCQMVGSDGATGRTVFTTTITYAAFSNYNLIVLVNGAVVEQGSGAGILGVRAIHATSGRFERRQVSVHAEGADHSCAGRTRACHDFSQPD